MDFYITLAISVLLQVIRDPKVNFKFKRALLKIFKEIAIQFGTDPEFSAVADTHVKKTKFE